MNYQGFLVVSLIIQNVVFKFIITTTSSYHDMVSLKVAVESLAADKVEIILDPGNRHTNAILI